jgi:hypothetical protein
MLRIRGDVDTTVAAFPQWQLAGRRGTAKALSSTPGTEVCLGGTVRFTVGAVIGLGQQGLTAVVSCVVAVSPVGVAEQTALPCLTARSGVGATEAALVVTATTVEDIVQQQHLAAVFAPPVAVIVAIVASTDAALAVEAGAFGIGKQAGGAAPAAVVHIGKVRLTTVCPIVVAVVKALDTVLHHAGALVARRTGMGKGAGLAAGSALLDSGEAPFATCLCKAIAITPARLAGQNADAEDALPSLEMKALPGAEVHTVVDLTVTVVVLAVALFCRWGAFPPSTRRTT